ncbi:MAG: SRPBCC family protein [Planctomycetota bacterium]
MRTTAEVTIDAPIDCVFERTNNDVAIWSDTVEDETLVSGDGGLGSRYQIRTVERGTEMIFDSEVTQHDPPNVSEVVMKGDSFDLRVRYEFASLGTKRTQVKQITDIRGHGSFRIILMLFGWLGKTAGRKAAEKELGKLKEHCEVKCE